MITSRDAAMILDRNGFRLPNADLDGCKIMYNDERVGTLYEDEIYLAVEFPHLRSKSYRETKKQGSILLGSSTAELDLDHCIQVLLDSPAAFEEESRNERIKTVKRYFNFARTLRRYYLSRHTTTRNCSSN